jgi:hypothetical protein
MGEKTYNKLDIMIKPNEKFSSEMSIFISYRFDCEMSNTAAPDDGHRKF